MKVFGRILPVCVIGLGLTGCGIGSWFGGESEPPLPGERISVLRSDAAVTADPAVAGIDVVIPAPALNPDWPQTGGTADHAPVHVELGQSLNRAWQVSIGEGTGRGRHIVSTPVVAGGRVFTMDAATRVTAVDAATGNRLWSRDMQPEGTQGGFGGGVAAFGDRVFVATGYGVVSALNAATGDPLWTRTVPAPIRSAPSFADGKLYVVTMDSRTEALDAATGQPVWTHAGIAETASVLGGASAAISRGAVVVPYNSGEVFALREDNGRMIWTDSLAALRRADVVSDLAAIRGHPVAYRGLVFATSHSGRTVAVDLRSGMRIWDRDFGGVDMPWAAGDFVFLLTSRNELLALVAAEGRVRWVNALPRYRDPSGRSDPVVWSGPVLAGGRLILVNSQSRAVFFSPTTGEQLGEMPLSAPATVPPVVADGTMYVLSSDGYLSAYR